jgi:broad specificity phosphatase PhoE
VLVLVKHSLPAIDPQVPASTWPLSDEGRRRCEPLAEQMRAFGPSRLVASDEPKAAETARLVGESLGLRLDLDERLREHDRTGVPFLVPEELQALIEQAFAEPEETVLGRESLKAARSRFEAAVDEHSADLDDGALGLVAHGTVISAFAAERTGVDGYELWGRLGLPSIVVVRGDRLVEVVEDV